MDLMLPGTGNNYERGEVISEARVRTGASGCSATESNANPSTFYAYDGDGVLTGITYPYGRQVWFAHDGGKGDRVTSLGATFYYPDAGTTSAPLIDAIRWEPFGGLRGYETNPGTAGVGGVEYTLPTNNTGLLSSINVSSGAFTLGKAGNLYSESYTWQADQVATTSTTLLGGTASTENFYYAKDLKLTSASKSPAVPYGSQTYNVDVWSRRTSHVLDGTTYNVNYESTAPYYDRLANVVPTVTGAAWQYNYTSNPDGTVGSKATGNDSSGSAAQTYQFYDGASGASQGGASETTYRSVSLNGASYGYFYDAKGRRRAKTYPSSITDEYFYDQSDQLLVDQGNGSYSSPSYFTDDDYIWLGGRPVAIIHGQLSTGWVRQPDSTASCGRMGDVGACGTYFPVTDHIGKVVVMVDSQARIVGTGEYDPFGQVNRVTTDKETTHNYCCGTSCPSNATTAEKNCNPSSPGGTRVDFATLNAGSVTGMTTDYRAKLQMIDLRSGYTCICSLPGKGISDSVGLAESNNDSAVITQSILGAHAGTNWTTWATPASGAAVAQLYYGYYTSTGQLSCFGTCVATAGPAFNRTGAVMEGWEYRRYTTGATPFWTPLRFPGQYHDEETDLNQNWNRFYEPMTGRYLEAEPLYTDDPDDIERQARSGRSVPYYAYASNNPISETDPTGLFALKDKCDNWTEAIALAKKWAGCDSGGRAASCPCSNKMAQCKATAKCDICAILDNSEPAHVKPAPMKCGKTIPDAEGCSHDSTRKGVITFNGVDFEGNLCSPPTDPSDLASVVLHEAVHHCASSSGIHVNDNKSDPCSAYSIEGACR